MDAIAAEAGVTKQTVYAHYHNKHMLFTQMVTELCKKHAPDESILKNKSKSLADLLYDVGLGFINMLTSKEGLAATRLVVGEAHRHAELAQLYYESGSLQMLNMMARILDEKKALGELKLVNSMSAASYFFSMLKGNYYLRILLNIKPLPTADKKETHVRECVKIFLRVYAGENPIHTQNML